MGKKTSLILAIFFTILTVTQILAGSLIAVFPLVSAVYFFMRGFRREQ